MNSLVLNEVRFPGKGFLIFTAFLRPFSSVNTLMNIRELTERFPTFTACIRPASTVNSLMLNEFRFAAKGLHKITAWISPV